MTQTIADPAATPRDDAAAGSAVAPLRDGRATSEWRPPDFAAVQEGLTLLARAVRQFHTYPADSPMCTDAIAACQKVLAGLSARDQVSFRVAPTHLTVDDVAIGAGTTVEHELARRLHRAQVASVDLARTVTARDLVRFSATLSAFGDATKAPLTFAEVLGDQGVLGVIAHTAHRPEVLDVEAPAEPLRQLVEHERQRRQALFAAGGPVQHLFPPDKGWVRIDPSVRYDAFSLVDLALLIDSPAAVATALMRLTGDDSATAADPAAAFEQKFNDLATIFSAVDPRLSKLLFSKLSRAVLDLESDRRTRLLKRTVLPGLLDGKLDGSVLAEFPDVDLADALCLLLDLETAAPDVLTAVLDRLPLSSERRRSLVPLIEQRLTSASSDAADPSGHDRAIERYARRLLEISAEPGRSFAEFTAFDLAVTDDTRAATGAVASAVASTDALSAQLETLLRLVRLEPNPLLVTDFMSRTTALFESLEGQQQWGALAQWAGRFRVVSAELRTGRPEVADAIAAGLEGFSTVPRVLTIADFYKADGKIRALAHGFIEGFGASPARAFLDALDDPTSGSSARPLISLMCDHAALFAPVLAAKLADCGVTSRPAVIRVLGFAGPSYLAPVDAVLKDSGDSRGTRKQRRGVDEVTGREALRALARMGTSQAAAAVAAQLEHGVAWASAAAEEALWHFPPAQAAAQVRQLLARRDFVLHHPDVAGRMLDRAAQARTTGLASVAATLTPLRYRFWNPALVRVAMKARQLLHP